MFKKETTVTSSIPTPTSTTPLETLKVEFTATALSTLHDPVTNAWGLVEITFDPTSKTVGNVTFTPAGKDKELAVELFKLNAVKKGLV